MAADVDVVGEVATVGDAAGCEVGVGVEPDVEVAFPQAASASTRTRLHAAIMLPLEILKNAGTRIKNSPIYVFLYFSSTIEAW